MSFTLFCRGSLNQAKDIFRNRNLFKAKYPRKLSDSIPKRKLVNFYEESNPSKLLKSDAHKILRSKKMTRLSTKPGGYEARCLLVFGKTGAGKSTFTNILLQTYSSESGNDVMRITGDIVAYFCAPLDLWIIDIPGWGDNKGLPTEDIYEDALRMVILNRWAIAGVFVLLKEKIGEDGRVEEDHLIFYKLLVQMFSTDIASHTLLLLKADDGVECEADRFTDRHVLFTLQNLNRHLERALKLKQNLFSYGCIFEIEGKANQRDQYTHRVPTLTPQCRERIFKNLEVILSFEPRLPAVQFLQCKHCNIFGDPILFRGAEYKDEKGKSDPKTACYRHQMAKEPQHGDPLSVKVHLKQTHHRHPNLVQTSEYSAERLLGGAITGAMIGGIPGAFVGGLCGWCAPVTNSKCEDCQKSSGSPGCTEYCKYCGLETYKPGCKEVCTDCNEYMDSLGCKIVCSQSRCGTSDPSTFGCEKFDSHVWPEPPENSEEHLSDFTRYVTSLLISPEAFLSL